MAIQTKTFAQLISQAATAVQGAASALIDMTVGSVLLAFLEAVSAIGMWLQGLALSIAALTRFASSLGADADSWAADFGFERLLALFTKGPVTFSRFTSTAQALVPVGAVVQTADGSQKYTVVADTTQPTFDPVQQAYVMAIGVASCTATVAAQVAGAAANAVAGAVNTIGSAIVGVDTVTNAARFINGRDDETDTAFRARFVLFINSLSKATPAAIGYAIDSVQQGVQFTLTEDQDYTGVADIGYFYVVIDDGSGAPPQSLLDAIGLAIDAARPVNSRFGVFPPIVLLANLGMTITIAPGYLASTIVATVNAALLAYINTLPIGARLPFTRLAQVAYDSSIAITNVSAVGLNGGINDLLATKQQVIKAGTIFIATSA